MWSDGLLGVARRTRDEVADALRRLSVPGELVLTGGTSVPGALTKGDIDLHLRVVPHEFADVVSRLRAAYLAASPASWAATLAVFDLSGSHPTGLAVTPVGSEHDRRFCRTWAAIRRDPELLARYNALKTAADDAAGYEDRKSAFFTELAGDAGGPGGLTRARPR